MGEFRRIRNTRVTVGEIRAIHIDLLHSNCPLKLGGIGGIFHPHPKKKSKVYRVFRELVNIKKVQTWG